MNQSRKRASNISKEQSKPKHVSFGFDASSSDRDIRKRANVNFWQHLRKRAIFAVIVFVVIYYSSSSSKLPKQVQNWHDSGYTFKFRNHVIHYQDVPRNWEPVSLTPVLLVIHGFPTSSYDWKDLIPKFHNRFGRIIIPDLLGFGFSDKPTNHTYSLKEQATMIEKLMNHLEIKDVHILAHDYGDTVTQELLARENDVKYELLFRIKSVCLTNGGIIPSEIQLMFIQKVLLFPVIRSFVPYLTNRFIFESRFSAVFGADTQPTSEQLNDFYAIILHNNGHLATPAIMEYLPERYANEKRWVGALKETSIPLHLIYGMLDPISTPEGFLAKYRKLVPQSTITLLQNVGHYPQLENQARFLKGFYSFLDKIESEYYVL